MEVRPVIERVLDDRFTVLHPACGCADCRHETRLAVEAVVILTGLEIRRRLEVGDLVIRPLKDEQLRQNGVDLVLHPEVCYLEFGGYGDADLPEEPRVRPVTKPLFIRQTCYLCRTEEWLEIPRNLKAFVQLRSTWARRGLSIPPTSADAGFKGTLTLEVLCAGPTQTIPVGQRFAHLIFAQLSGISEPYDGKYQGQVDVTGARPDPA